MPNDVADRRRVEDAAAWIVQHHSNVGVSHGRARIEDLARQVLAKVKLPLDYLGWTMVVVGSALWRERVTAIPFERRLLLLPHCMRSLAKCPATMDAVGLQCVACGACDLHRLKARAEGLGYRVLIAEGSPIVMQLILAGQADAVLGVGCLDSLEKSLDKLLTAGVPGLAVPLFGCDCRDSKTDLDAVAAMIDTPYEPRPSVNGRPVTVLRAAHRLFQMDELLRLLPPTRGEAVVRRLREVLDRDESSAIDREQTEFEPLIATELLAYEFLLRGGKHFRPFITLAAYDAMARPEGEPSLDVEAWPEAVQRVAMAIEVFHKASLIHDDIEDDDAFRYGYPTLHRAHGVAAAINVGDFLIGLGYRIVTSQESLGAEVVAQIAARLAIAHTRLSEGQGAELAWRAARVKRIAPLDALKIYALKTSPAFEVALHAGLRCAGPVDGLQEPMARFSRQLGVAFQILNDLEDWHPTAENKRLRGGDILGGRPTLLLALALERLEPREQDELLDMVALTRPPDASMLDRVAELYAMAEVRSTAMSLVRKHAARAREIADSVAPPRLAELLHYFVDTIIGR